MDTQHIYELRKKIAPIFMRHETTVRATGKQRRHELDYAIDEYTGEVIDMVAQATQQAVLEALGSLPFTERESGCMNCMATSIVQEAIAQLKQKAGKRNG
jgi:hypothetical protein